MYFQNRDVCLDYYVKSSCSSISVFFCKTLRTLYLTLPKFGSKNLFGSVILTNSYASENKYVCARNQGQAVTFSEKKICAQKIFSNQSMEELNRLQKSSFENCAFAIMKEMYLKFLFSKNIIQEFSLADIKNFTKYISCVQKNCAM